VGRRAGDDDDVAEVVAVGETGNGRVEVGQFLAVEVSDDGVGAPTRPAGAG
jgi:hypothetical protein